ncbi:MAG: GTP-binding protein [Candidatus Thermoplasmatota archaeon]|nr:GTP-binding protein [Euryarchaeota archaeon]MBU4031804.1 GTP-binding protein [Candidatus Thermoplasmatota archaeon]MBU4071834.1 GTP-binding protein [Candidatus Thermoplasmatota archaeon]MBU4145327.1 GTP-binding protein [Candidatus Thermoplasmatota archaeon]MBU4592219.1 GTP-binding protein [Candidatus Thermoplasmatota archaeon]
MEIVKKNIILLGDGATGKSSLIRRFVTDQFNDKYMTTLGSRVTKKDVYLNHKGVQTHMVLLIWDILGQKNYPYTQALSFGGIEGALLVSDLTRKATLNSLKEYWIPSLISVTGSLPMVFIGNKSDLRNDAEFWDAELKKLASNYEPCEIRNQYFLTSAKEGNQVESAFKELAAGMLMINEKVRLTYSQFIIDKTEIDNIKGAADRVIADFSNQFGGAGNAGPVLERLILEVGLDIENPTKKELVELVNAMAGVEEKFKPQNTVGLNRAKRLYLINMF